VPVTGLDVHMLFALLNVPATHWGLEVHLPDGRSKFVPIGQVTDTSQRFTAASSEVPDGQVAAE
jgi:hypothetical protein